VEVGGLEDQSVIVEELNEDVKALDDLFRSISFREADPQRFQPPLNSNCNSNSNARSGNSISMTPAYRCSSDPITIPPTQPQCTPIRISIRANDGTIIEEETNPCSPTTMDHIHPQTTSNLSYHDTELKEALEAYRHLLDNYSGEDLRTHQADYTRILQEVATLQTSNHSPTQLPTSFSTTSTSQNPREKSLYMTIIVYDRIRTAQQATLTSLLSSTPNPTPSLLLRHQSASIDLASTMIRIGSLNYKLANVDEELHMYHTALRTYTAALGEHHPYVAGTRKNIGMVLAERSDYDAAMEQFHKARSIYSSLDNAKGVEMSDDVASALLCMGNVQSRRNEYDSALSSYSKALHIYRTLADDDSGNSSSSSSTTTASSSSLSWSPSSIEKVTSTLKTIGMVYAKRDDLPSAMECFREALTLLESSAPSSTRRANGVGVASIRTRMGGIYYKRGRYDDAMAQYQIAYRAASTALGTTVHPDVAGITHYVGVVYQKRGDHVRAMECYRKSVGIYRRTLGSDSPALATTLVCMGSIYYRRRDLDRALEFYNEAYRLYENSYGPHHPQVAPTLKSVAMIHTKKGEYDEAMELFRTVLRMKVEVVGECHPEVANAYKSIAIVYLKRGQLGEALRQYGHALDMYRRTVGEGHPDVRLIRNEIVRVRERIVKERRNFGDAATKDVRLRKRRVVSSSRFST